MTSQDFSYEFDILYNNISSNRAPGLTEYEKSVFLTQAQEALILDLYKGTAGDSFETTEEVTRYLGSLVTKVVNKDKKTSTSYPHYFEYDLESDVWFIIYQSVSIIYKTTEKGEDLTRDVLVVPTSHDSLFKDIKNPFRGPNSNKVLSITEEGKIKLYTNYDVNAFYYKYLKRPNPIVLENSEFPINDVSDFDIEVPESLHRQILLRAVQMAKAVWAS